MADEQQNFEDLIRIYNLTSEEKSRVEEQQNKSPFTAETLKEFISQMRIENAKELAGRKDEKINYDELQVAWETVKDAKEGDDLYKTKVALQEKSEEELRKVSPDVDLNMATAPETSEWLAINDSIGNDTNKQRNAQISNRLVAFYKQYDEENGLGAVSPEIAAQIVQCQKQLETKYADFDPFAEENGQLKNPEFANSKAFYDRLKIDNKDPNSDTVDKEKYKKEMIELAKREAISTLSAQPNFHHLSEEEKDRIFKTAVAQFMEEGCVKILVAETTAKLTETQQNNPQEQKKLQEQAKTIIKSFAAEPAEITISNSAANGVHAARLHQQVNFEKRIAQKSGVRGLWGKIKEIKKNFEKDHPKTAGIMKALGNLGLPIGVNIVAGPAGLATLSAIRLYKAHREAAKELREQGKDTNIFKTVGYMFKSPKYRQKLLGATAGIVFAGVGVATGGLDVNGLLGQGLSHGWGHAAEGLSNMAHSAWQGIAHPLDTLRAGFGDAHPLAAVKSFAMPKDGLRIARLSTTMGTFFDRIGTEAYEAKKKGKKFPLGRALLDATVTAIMVALTTHVHHDGGDMTPTPDPDPNPNPTPEPTPTPVHHPAPHPTPAPEVTPESEITPEPEVTPESEITPEPAPAPEPAPVTEETRDEAYYQEQKDALNPEGENSLKKGINLARKADGYTIEEAVDNKIDGQVEGGALSEQQGEELKNYTKSELDAADGTTDGEINEDEISRGDVRRAMNRVEDTLDSMKNNADEVLLAENLENIPEFTDTPAESFSHDTRSPEFYKGISDTIDKMQNGDEPLSKAMSTAIKNGELSAEQATVMNGRYSELRAEGHSMNETLEIMKKDYLNEQKYWAAQATDNNASELGSGEVNNVVEEEPRVVEEEPKVVEEEPKVVEEEPKVVEEEPKVVEEEPKVVEEEPKVVEEEPKVVEEELKANEGNEANVLGEDEATIVSRYGTFDKALYDAAPFSMEDAAKLQNGQIVFAKDELGNAFCMGKDDDGNAFRMTIGTNFSKTGESFGAHTFIDVPEDSPHYHAVKGYLLETDDKFGIMHAEMDTQGERDGYIDEIMQKIKNHDFEIVKAEDLGKEVAVNGDESFQQIETQNRLAGARERVDAYRQSSQPATKESHINPVFRRTKDFDMS